MANRFVLNETSYHGAGAIAEIATETKIRGFKKAFVCSDPDLVKFGVTQKVLDVLEKNGMAYELYSNIKPNPTIENVQTGVQAFKDAGTDYLIAIGGGSSMDTAKAIGLMGNAGIKASQAGTSMRSIMTNLTGDVKLSGYAKKDKISVQYFDVETAELKLTEMYVTGYKAKLKKDTSYKGLWTVSFTLKEM